MTSPFQQPLLTYSPNLEPPGWNLLRDMLMRKIFSMQGNPYGYNPGANGPSMASLWSGGGRGLFNPYTGSYGSSPGGGGAPGGGSTVSLPPRPTGPGLKGVDQPTPGGGMGGRPPFMGTFGGNRRIPPPPMRDGQSLGYDAPDPLYGGQIPAARAGVKNPMDRHMLLRLLMARRPPMRHRNPMRPTRQAGLPVATGGMNRNGGAPLGMDARMPAVPATGAPTSSPATSGANGIPRTGATSSGTQTPVNPTATAGHRTGTSTAGSGGSGGGTDPSTGKNWDAGYHDPGYFPNARTFVRNYFPDWPQRNLGNMFEDPATRPPDASNDTGAPPVFQGPPSSGDRGGGEFYGPHFDGIGYDSPYMFQRGPQQGLGYDGPEPWGPTSGVGTSGGTLINFQNHPGSSLTVPRGTSEDVLMQMLNDYMQSQGWGATAGDTGGVGSAAGGGGGGGGASMGGGMPGFRRRKPQTVGRVLGTDAYTDNVQDGDFGMMNGDNPSAVGPFKAPPRPMLASASSWGNW